MNICFRKDGTTEESERRIQGWRTHRHHGSLRRWEVDADGRFNWFHVSNFLRLFPAASNLRLSLVRGVREVSIRNVASHRCSVNRINSFGSQTMEPLQRSALTRRGRE